MVDFKRKLKWAESGTLWNTTTKISVSNLGCCLLGFFSALINK